MTRSVLVVTLQAHVVILSEAKNLSGFRLMPSSSQRRADMYLSTLRSVIEAMGGELDVRAVFPDGSGRIKRLKEMRKRA